MSNDDNLLGGTPEPERAARINVTVDEPTAEAKETEAAPLVVTATQNDSPAPSSSVSAPTAPTTTSEAAPLGQAPSEPQTTAPVNSAPTSAPSGIQVNSPAAEKVKADYDAITDALLGSIGDIGEKENFKFMLYGPPGSAKSSFLGGVPSNLIYDFEGGLIAAKTAHVHSGRRMAQGVQSIPYKSMVQADALLERLTNRHPDFDKFEVFSLDTVSDMHKRMLEVVTKREFDKRPSSKNLYVPETEEYTEVNEILVRFVRRLRDLDRDVIVLAHAQTVEPKGKPAKTYPDFSEKLANKLEAMMDIVGYMEMREVEIDGVKVNKPVLRVVSEGTIHAKTRVPLPAEILDPTYTDLRNAWENAIKDGTLAEQ